MSITERISLSDAIADLRSQIQTAVAQGAGAGIKFLAEELTVEFQLVAGTAGKTGGGVKFYIFNADANVETNTALTQKVILKMKVVEGPENGSVKIKSKGRKGELAG